MGGPLPTAGAPPPGGGEGPFGPFPLVGRARELAGLEALIEERGHGSSVLMLSGEGGVGKSRLASELAHRARERGWTALTGRAYPVETGVPYALFADAFVPLIRDMDPDRLTILSRGGEAELKNLFPVLANPGEAIATAFSATEPEEFRTRLMWNFAEFAKALAARGPVLVVLEDLQWADASSLELLHFLARQARGSSLVMLCTYNETERDRSPQLIRTERSLVSLGVCNSSRLEPLTREQVSELVSRTFEVDEAVVREFSALLFGWTHGNPFFLEEIVKSLIRSGRLSNRAGTWVGWDAGDFELPGTVRDAVIARVAGFSADARTVAELAAVVGARAGYRLLTSISKLPEDALLSALEELCAHRLLEEGAESGEVFYHFTHPLVRQTLYEEFGLQRSRLLHGAVAEAMEVFYGDRAMDHADELAFHFARSDGGGQRAKAVRYLAEAGRRALGRGADREAVDYLRAALDRVSNDDTDEEGGTHVRLMQDLATAHLHLGDFEDAVGLWERALASVPAGTAQYADIRRSLGLAHFFCGRHAEAHEHFERGLEAAAAANSPQVIVGLRLGHGYCLQEIGRPGEALETIESALPVAEQVGDPGLLARVHRSLALLYVWAGPSAEAREHAQRAIELAERVGDASVEFWARWGLAVLDGMSGNVDAMSQGIEELNQLADRVRSPVLGLWTADMAIELEFGRGEWDRGIALGERLIALARNLNQRTLLPRLLVWTSLFYTGRGELERARALVDEAVSVSGLGRHEGPVDVHVVVPAYIGLAHYFLALGECDQAIEHAKRGLAIAEGAGYTLWIVHRLLPVLAESLVWAGRIDEVEEVAVRLRHMAESMDHKLGIAWADAGDGLVLWKRGDRAGSIPLLRKAAEALEAIPMVPYAVRIRRQIAARLIEIGEKDEALGELKEVHDVLDRLGAGVELELTRQMIRALGVRPPPKGVGQGRAGLTARELEVARAAARGLSNKAVAKELGMASRTASTHLSNIYKKLELGSRNELAEWMRREGLLED